MLVFPMVLCPESESQTAERGWGESWSFLSKLRSKTLQSVSGLWDPTMAKTTTALQAALQVFLGKHRGLITPGTTCRNMPGNNG